MNNMKKILIFSLNYYPKYIGGAEVAIKEIVERQDKNKFEWHMITLRFDSNLPKYEVIHGIHIHRIGFTKKGATISELKKFPLFLNKFYYQIFGGFYAIKLNLKYNYDAAWAMMPTATGVPMSYLKIFSKIFLKDKIKTIVTFQEGDPIPYMVKKVLPGWPFFVYSIRSANIVQSISTFLLNWSKDLGFKGNGVIIPNAVDVKQFTRNISEQEILDVRNKLEKKDGEIWLVTTSRLVHKNGIDDCINAIAKLDSKYHFAILGIGPDFDKLKKIAEDLNISNRIHFVGQVAHPLMAVYLKACDIFIRPSRSEGMGNSFVEAMSMKMPVIATTEGGLSDFIFNQKTAWVVEKDNPESIKQAVLKIENISSEDKKKILETSYNMVIEKYDWELIGRRMQTEVFDKI